MPPPGRRRTEINLEIGDCTKEFLTKLFDSRNQLTTKQFNKLKELIVATKEEVLAKIAEIHAGVTSIQADVQALKDLVASGADLTEIAEAVNALGTHVDEVDALFPEAPPPPPPPPPESRR